VPQLHNVPEQDEPVHPVNRCNQALQRVTVVPQDVPPGAGPEVQVRDDERAQRG
jgi:hypothetical protein